MDWVPGPRGPSPRRPPSLVCARPPPVKCSQQPRPRSPCTHGGGSSSRRGPSSHAPRRPRRDLSNLKVWPEKARPAENDSESPGRFLPGDSDVPARPGPARRRLLRKCRTWRSRGLLGLGPGHGARLGSISTSRLGHWLGPIRVTDGFQEPRTPVSGPPCLIHRSAAAPAAPQVLHVDEAGASLAAAPLTGPPSPRRAAGTLRPPPHLRKSEFCWRKKNTS